MTIFNRNFFTNKVLLWSILASIGLISIGIYGPYISNFLHFTGLRIHDWLFVLSAAVLFLVVFEFMKMTKRFKRKKSK